MINELSNAERAEVLTQALPYIKRYTGKTVVVKYGGNAMVSEKLKQQVMEDIVLLWLIGVKVVLVHGGGPEISELMGKLGKTPEFIDGLRVTDKETVDIVQMVLAGKVNKSLVNLLEMHGGRAIGLSGLDGRLIEAAVKDEKLGYVGEIKKINIAPFTDLLEKGYIPVISTLGCDEAGNTYNINGDTAAAYIAGALNAERMLLMTDIAGILRDRNDPSTLIPEISISEAEQLYKEGVISEGMVPKVNCCIEAIKKGVKNVIIMNGCVNHSVLMELLTDEGAGTMFTGKKDMSIKEKDAAYIADTYARFPVVLSSGKGSYVTDEKGKEYIDMGSGIGVTSFGFADDKWQEAVAAQAGKLQHTSNLYYTEPCAVLAEKLCEKTGMKKVFFSNSGAEANECAIKAARKYAAEKKGADCFTVVTMKNSFHGRTLTTLAATGQEHYHELYNPLTPGFVSVDTNNIFELEVLGAKHKIAAIMLECIQGEGGVEPLKKSFVNEVAEYAERNDIILIVDEVQTGNGRTGKLYSYMNYGITPDIVTTAKGLAGGLPLGATLLGEKVQNVFGHGDHGSTFGGNPVCCAAAVSILDRIDDGLLAGVSARGEYLQEAFKDAPGIEAVTGMGLMLGLKTTKPAAQVVNELIDNGVLCLTAKDKVRLLPALNIPMEALQKAAETIKKVCAE